MTINGTLNLVLNLNEIMRSSKCDFEVKASKKECKELASVLGVESVKNVQAFGFILEDEESRYTLKASLKGQLIQKCVISLSPVKTLIDKEIERHFFTAYRKPQNQKSIEIFDSHSDRFEDPVEKEFDIGRIVLEEISLLLPDYPKKLNAKFEGVTVTKSGIGPLQHFTNKPFSDLEKLIMK